MACETDAYSSASLQHCDFTMYLPVWTFETFESQSFCSGSRQLATHCGTVLTSWRSSWVSQLTSIHRRGFIRLLDCLWCVCSLFYERHTDLFDDFFVIHNLQLRFTLNFHQFRPPVPSGAGTPGRSFQVWRFAWKFAGTDVNQARCFWWNDVSELKLDQWVLDQQVQHTCSLSLLSKFPSSYQFNNHGNVGHRGFHMFMCWFIAMKSNLNCSKMPGWRGCMEASRKGLNALRNSTFPQICELVARISSELVLLCSVKVWTSRWSQSKGDWGFLKSGLAQCIGAECWHSHKVPRLYVHIMPQ